MQHKYLVSVAVIVACMGIQAPSRAATAINISYQPVNYWALPFYIATKKGWWKDVGLMPSFSTFPAGPPQIAAAQAKSWDVGGTGSVPAVLGAARFGIITIGLTNDESKTNALLVRGDKYAAVKANPKLLKGQRLLVTTNSTVDYASRACLKKFGLGVNDMQVVNLGQAQIITAFTSNNGDFAGVWAPNTYTLEEKDHAKVLCNGADAGVVVPGALIARADYAKKHPGRVAKFLAVYLHAWTWAKAHPKQAHAMTKAFYAQGGVDVSDNGINQEFALRPVFPLAAQLKMMDRSKGSSQVDGWFSNIGAFLKQVGTIQANPDPKTYLDDSSMKRVAADAKLSMFANDASAK